ncbi:MAG: DUF1573 domain-containing protein [Candidatus Latescibacterota bacterium]
MKNKLKICIIIMVISINNAMAITEHDNMPKIRFDELSYDFGIVKEGVKLYHSFLFENTGNDTLKIYARSSCSCVKSYASDNINYPGKVSFINVELNTKGKSGHFKNDILIRTNDPKNNLVILSVSATINGTIELEPEKIWVGEVTRNENIEREILVRILGKNDITIKSIEAPYGINTEIKPIHYYPMGKEIPIKLLLNVGADLGNFNKTINLITNENKQKELKYLIYGKVIDDYSVYPPSILFKDVKPDSSYSRNIVIKQNTKKRNKIKNITTKYNFIQTKINSDKDLAKNIITVNLKIQNMETDLLDTLFVNFDNKKVPELKIPLTIMVKK